MSRTRVGGRRPRARAAVTPAHLSAEQAAVWSALRLAVDGAGGRPVLLQEALAPLQAIAPAVAAQALRVELLFEALAADPRSGVVAERALGGGAPRYGMPSA